MQTHTIGYAPNRYILRLCADQRGTIQHYDFSSSYPTVMLCEKYPMTPWIMTYITKMPDPSTFNKYAYIFHLRARKLECTTNNTYLQASKCAAVHIKYDNGRIISADSCEFYCTEQDWLTIKETYKWESLEILGCYTSKKAYLPRPFLKYILELYRNKTILKGVAGQEDLYMQSKQYINSLFGMCVTAILQSDVEYDNGEWFMVPLTSALVEEKFEKLRKEQGKVCNYFLSYSWGCWVTAYARRNLWRCIETVDKELLYCDTDSIFVLGEHDFSWYDTEVTEKLRKACEDNRLNFEDTRPCDKKGKERPLGIFTEEDECSEFITLGAKRYVERRKNDGKLHLTVSGINKEAVELLDDKIENFRDGFNFDKDAECVKKRLAVYVNEQPTVTYPDGYVSSIQYGINMRRTGYNLTITDEYKNLIEYFTNYFRNASEQFQVTRRGWFV